ncbi:MAG: NAD-binding protein [Planctomycetaceae bacterium]
MRQLLIILLLLLTMTVIGTLGIHFTTEKSWMESTYLAIITMTTVGSREAPDANDTDAMLFIMGYLVFGGGVFAYGAFTLGQMIVNTKFRQFWEQRKMNGRISSLKGHYIVCGMGRMGTDICEYLADRKQPFVVIDRDLEVLNEIESKQNWLFLHGDSSEDDVLRLAGIEQAKAIATTLPTDADNLYVVLSARMLAPNIQIVARASDDNAIVKLMRAGATRVISPFSSGAVKMARIMLNPSIEDFLEVTDSLGSDLELVDLLVKEGGSCDGKKLSETDFRQRGVIVIAIRRPGEKPLMPPPGTATICAGDSLLVFGSSPEINKLLAENS